MKSSLILYSLAIGITLGSILGRTTSGHWVTACGVLLLIIAVALSYIRYTKKGTWQ